MVQDIEDGLDQAMIQAWQNTAQSLRQLHGQLRQDIRQSMRERRATMDRERSTRAEQRRMLADWEKQNRQRLNTGFEQTLRATVLNPAFLKEPRPSDTDLLKSWAVTDWLAREGEPGFAAELRRAQDILRTEWANQHGSNIEAAADQATNSITVYYRARSQEMQDTVEQLGKAGITGIDRIELDDREYRRRFGDKATFHCVSRMSGEWDGWDRDAIAQAVLVNPLSGSADELGDRVRMLRETRLPESSGADDTAVGDEDRDAIAQAVLVNPLSGSADELGDRVRMLRETRLPESSGADDTAVGDEPSSAIAQAVLVNPLSGSADELGDRVRMLRETRLPESSGADDTAVGDEPSSLMESGAYESQPAAPITDTPTKASQSGAGLPKHADPAASGASDDMPVGLDEPEEWHGPDMFGEYSVPEEAGLAEVGRPDGNAAFTPETIPDFAHTTGTRRKS